jgi:orotidine-5'-phosphate decarboxylase
VATVASIGIGGAARNRPVVLPRPARPAFGNVRRLCYEPPALPGTPMNAADGFANPVFCAIDRPDLPAALELARSLVGTIGGVKLGLEMFTANGPAAVRQLSGLGLPVFLDLKLHDIPNTVAGAVRAVLPLAPAMLTLHAAGGRAMLRAAVAAAAAAPMRPWLLGITVLTSLDAIDLAEVGVPAMPQDQALRMAELCAQSGVDGVVCSPHEIAALRQRFGRRLRLVVPGIRAQGEPAGDQKRTMAPAEALALGADVLVIGRPITQAEVPRLAAETLARGLARAA